MALCIAAWLRAEPARKRATADGARCACAGERRVTVVRSPRSGVNFFDLGEFEEQMAAAYARAQPAMRQVRERQSSRRQPSPIRRAGT